MEAELQVTVPCPRPGAMALVPLACDGSVSPSALPAGTALSAAEVGGGWRTAASHQLFLKGVKSTIFI